MAVSYPIVSGAPIQLQPGFRFRPTDEEIVVHYLRRRALNEPLPSAPIADFDVLSHNPWELPDIDDGSVEKFYFSQRVPARWPRGNRCNRAAGGGHWKASGKDAPILISNGVNGVPLVVGLKTPFVFYRGNAPVGEKTEWFMEEYSLVEAGLTPCRVMRPRGGSSNLGECGCAAAVIAKKNDELSEALRNVVARLNMEPVMVKPDDSWVVCRIYQKKKSVPRALANCYDTAEGGQVPFFYFLGQANSEGTASSGSHSGSPSEKENDDTGGTE